MAFVNEQVGSRAQAIYTLSQKQLHEVQEVPH
jgi:hypothetical protein